MANNSIPTPRSFTQILNDNINGFLSRSGIPSVKIGGPLLSIFEAISQSQLKNSADIFTLLQSNSLNFAQGLAIDRIGADEQVFRIGQTPASGLINIFDTSFKKINSKISQSTPAPIVGSVAINIVDGTLFPSIGSIYLGRTTNNYEGPIAYTSIVNNGNYWTINLSIGTLRFHNVGESVILSQGGDRLISSGTVVQTPQGNVNNSVQFQTIFSFTIPDGETEIDSVPIVALIPGITGNVISNSITQFSSAPFFGASLTNPLPFTNGLAIEDDDSYKERIRQTRQSRTQGTELAVQTAAIGVVATDENKRVVSASIIDEENQPTVLFIDDGTGYEEIDEGIAIETFVGSALGGEQYFKISNSRPVTKAYVPTDQSAPFILSNGQKLAFTVGGVLTEHTFNSSDFFAINNATAYEVVSSINGNSTLLWSARTIKNATKVAVFGKSDVNEYIENIPVLDGIDANTVLGFSTFRVDTMRLYKNDVLLNKDGSVAKVFSNSVIFWSSLSGPQSLVMEVDGILLNFDGISLAKFTDQDFINAQTGFNAVGINSLQAWAKVFNYRIPGITAVVQGALIIITSNRDASSLAQVNIIGGDLVNNHMFQTQNSIGIDNEYTLNRNTGEFALTVPLVAGDNLTAGTFSTRAFIQSSSLNTINILSDANLWFDVDANAHIIPTGLTTSTALTLNIFSGEFWGKRVQFLNIANPLWSNVQVGDWAIFYDPVFSNLKGAFRVDFANDNTFTIEKPDTNSSRFAHRLVTLNDGRILSSGGYTSSNSGTITTVSSKSSSFTAELYDSVTYRWAFADPMSIPRAWHTATLLASGKVLVVGGIRNNLFSSVTNTCEIYNPISGLWAAAANLPIAVCQHTATLLNNNKVLVTGGRTSATTFTSNTYEYDEGGNSWAAVGNLSVPRALHTANIMQPTGNVIVACGENLGGVLASSDLYTGVWGAPAAGSPSISAHSRAAATIFAGNKVYVTGGSTAVSTLSDVVSNVVDIYTDGVGWTVGSSLVHARCKHVIEAVPDNNMVVVFGSFGGSPIPSIVTEVFTSGPDTWADTSNPMSVMINGTGPAVNTRIYAQGSLLTNINPLNGSDAIIVSGGLLNDLINVSSVSDIYKENTNQWYIPDVSIPNPFSPPVLNLGNTGIVIVRTSFLLEQVTIPTDNNFTASTLVDALNGTYISSTLESSMGLVGAEATLYKTNKIRVNTNSFKVLPDYLGDPIRIGDISLVAADLQGQQLLLPISDAIVNSIGQLASSESHNSEVGTPDFHQSFLNGSVSVSSNRIFARWSLDPNGLFIDPNVSYSLNVGIDLPDQTGPRYNSNLGFSSFIKVLLDDDNNDLIALRINSVYPWIPNDRLFFTAPYGIGPNDNFTVLIDGNVESKRYSLNMWRQVSPTTSTYSQTNFFTDSDNSGQSLAVGFGLNFNFNDFAVYMAARAKTDILDFSKTVLWRYTRLGPDGDFARVQYGLPSAPNSSVGFVINNSDNEFNDITITLASGILKTGYPLTNQAVIGEVAVSIISGITTVYYIFGYPIITGSRTAGVTTLQLLLPLGVNNTGLQVGGLYNFVSNNIFLPSNNVTILSITQSVPLGPFDTITYNDGTPGNAGPIASPGVIYPGFQQVSNLTGGVPPIVQGDFFRINSGAFTDPAYQNVTIRISNDPTVNPFWIEGIIENFTGAVTQNVTLYSIGSANAVQIFANASQTAAAIVNAVKNINLSDSRLSVQPTLVGTGTGIIDRSSAESALVSPAYVQLSDGLNYIQMTTPPGTVLGNYQMSFKLAINNDLVINSDWDNEIIRLVPKTNKNVIDWFNALTVSGLSSSAEVVGSSQGKRVQIATTTPGSSGSVQVQGGTANSATVNVVGSSSVVGNYLLVTVPKSNISGFYADLWTSVDNSERLPKAIIDASTQLNSITLIDSSQALFTLNSSGTPIWTYSATPSNSALVVVEPQGKFMAYTATSPSSNSINFVGVKEGDWVRIILPQIPLFPATPIDGSNTGIFRVVRVVNNGLDGESGTFWIENIAGVLQNIAECDIQFFTFDSMMPGDELIINTSIWGANNLGTWKIVTVGDTGTGVGFTSPFLFTVDITDEIIQLISSPVPPLGSSNNLVQVIEFKPSRMIKQILSISPNQDSSDFYDFKFTSNPGVSRINASGGSIISALDKLDFDLELITGIDGYKHSLGLIGAVNRVLYGDPSDPITFPGVVAASSNVNISGPLVKIIKVALAIRVQSSITLNNLTEQVQDAIANVINNTGIGQPIALSSLIAAAQSITGVISAVMINPSPITGADLITVNVFEKPLVVNIKQDISISFIGST